MSLAAESYGTCGRRSLGASTVFVVIAGRPYFRAAFSER